MLMLIEIYNLQQPHKVWTIDKLITDLNKMNIFNNNFNLK